MMAATTANPYLQGQANAITQQATQNLRNNILPGVNQQSMAAGGFGGSRNQLAQGLAIGQTNQGITNSLANLYGNAYEQDQNRAQQMAIANLQNDTQRYGIDQNMALGRDRLGLDSRIAEWQNNLGLGNLDVARQNAGTNRYSAEQQALYNQGQLALGQGQLALGNRQADQSYNLGLGNLGVAQQNAGTNRYSAEQQAAYNQGQLSLGNRTADQNYALGQGQLGVAQQNAATNAQQAANAYTLGLQQNENQRYGLQNQYDLGLRNNDLGYYTADQNFGLGQAQLQNQAQANMMSQQTANRGLDIQAQQAAAQAQQQALMTQIMQGQGLQGLGQQDMNSALAALQQYSSILQPFSGLNSTVSQNTSGSGGGLAGAIGGGLTMWQLLNMLGRSGG